MAKTKKRREILKSEVLRLRITPELKEKVQAQAEAENRTLTNWLETLIKRELERVDKKENA